MKLETVETTTIRRISKTIVQRGEWETNTVSYARHRLSELEPIRGEWELDVGESALVIMGYMDGKYFACGKF